MSEPTEPKPTLFTQDHVGRYAVFLYVDSREVYLEGRIVAVTEDGQHVKIRGWIWSEWEQAENVRLVAKGSQ